MNERIQELYKQATGKDWVYDFDPDYAEQFAELIVYEICGIVEEDGSAVLPLVIKRHFGIE